MDDMLIVSDYHSLLTLHTTIIEAKFSEELIHKELPGSPFLAQIANQLVEILIKKEIESGKDSSMAWKKWREIDETRREWHVAIKHIKHHEQIWRAWTRTEKEEFVRILLSPYIVNSESLNSFIVEIDTNINHNNIT